jgi:hypothetical protein
MPAATSCAVGRINRLYGSVMAVTRYPGSFEYRIAKEIHHAPEERILGVSTSSKPSDDRAKLRTLLHDAESARLLIILPARCSGPREETSSEIGYLE